MKLILLFGLWLNPANIAYLRPMGNECKIVFTEEKSITAVQPCNEVAAEIERKAK